MMLIDIDTPIKFTDVHGKEIEATVRHIIEMNHGEMPSEQPERKTGRWIHDGYDHPHGIDWMHCSVCGRREPHVPAAMTNYCPNCGARMDGE